MAFNATKCATCPVTLPACGGQLNPGLCNPDNVGLIDPDTGEPVDAATDQSTAEMTAIRNERGKTASSLYFGWPAP